MPEALRAFDAGEPAGSAAFRTILREVPGAEWLAPGLLRLPGLTSVRLLAASSLVIDGEPPLLVDAGMAPAVAAALRDLKLPLRLHLTHMHLDHRLHESWFAGERISAPAAEARELVDWEAWWQAGGFDPSMRELVDAWRRSWIPDGPRPAVDALEDGDVLPDLVHETRLCMLPGHTAGHSGLWLPGPRIMVVTDYDMERFGPWYGNASSDLDAYTRTLREQMADDGVELFVTLHRRAALSPELFRREGQRYLDQIAARDGRLLEWLRESRQGLDLETLSRRGLIYPRRGLERNPMLVPFERRMIELHMQGLAAQGCVRRRGLRWVAE